MSDQQQASEGIRQPLLGAPLTQDKQLSKFSPKKRSTLLTVCPYILGERLQFHVRVRLTMAAVAQGFLSP